MSHVPLTHRLAGFRTKGLRWCLAIFVSFLALATQAQSLVGAQSRKTHLGVDYNLPIDVNQTISGAVTFEPRPMGAGHNIVFQFDGPITQAGTVSSTPTGSTSAQINPGNSSEVVVTLTGVADNTRVTVTLSGVNGGANSFPVSLGFRVGDFNNTGTVTAVDVSSARLRTGQTVTAGNFQFDLNTSGLVSAADLSAVKRRSGLYNAPPVVNAGSNQTITLPATASLSGTATDDGLPNPPATLTLTWSRFSGPGTVVFGNANAASTSATFTVAGTYVLRLSASDSAATTTSDVTVTVNPGPATTLNVAGLTSPRTAGTAGNITVTARDANGNTATGYTGTVQVGSSDGGATLPANYTFTAGDAGVRSFAVTLNTVGTQSITVTDVGNGSIVGSQTGIVVNSAVMPGLFEKPHPWNKDVSAFPVSSRSAAIIAAMNSLGGWGGPSSTRLHIDFSLPLLFANASTPIRSITGATYYNTDYCYNFGPDCEPVPFSMPVPANGNTEGGVTSYACPAPGDDDCHVLVVDTSTKKLYELYQANGTATNLTAFAGFIWDLTKQYGDVLRGDQCTSADAAGLPIAALLPTADEVAAGEIPHALRFILPNPRMKKGNTANGVFVRPATHAGGPSNTTNPDAPPYGVRLRLKASFDENAAFPNSPGARVVARALKKYGMILSDGGNIPLTFADDRLSTNKWANPNINITSQTLSNMPVTLFDVVDLGPEIVNTFNCVRAP